MEKGKLYKSVIGEMVVFCTTILDDKRFEGIVVDSGNTLNGIGYISNGFMQNSFKEYAPIKTLFKGYIYDIPKGCVATINNGQVLIESNTKYIKHSLEDFTIYSRHISGGKTTIVTFYCHGDVVVESSLEMSSADISDCGKKIDENEFTNACNTALKNLELWKDREKFLKLVSGEEANLNLEEKVANQKERTEEKLIEFAKLKFKNRIKSPFGGYARLIVTDSGYKDTRFKVLVYECEKTKELYTTEEIDIFNLQQAKRHTLWINSLTSLKIPKDY